MESEWHSTIKKMKVVDIKAQLRTCGLSVKGKKDVLVCRLAEALEAIDGDGSDGQTSVETAAQGNEAGKLYFGNFMDMILPD